MPKTATPWEEPTFEQIKTVYIASRNHGKTKDWLHEVKKEIFKERNALRRVNATLSQNNKAQRARIQELLDEVLVLEEREVRRAKIIQTLRCEASRRQFPDTTGS